MGHYASEMMPMEPPRDWEIAGFIQDIPAYRVSCGTCRAILNKQDWREHQRWHDLTATQPATTPKGGLSAGNK